jgi:tetratricopeptide (TPR) repeat protein
MHTDAMSKASPVPTGSGTQAAVVPLHSALALIVERAQRIAQANGAAIRAINGHQLEWLACTGVWFREERYARRCLQTGSAVNCSTFRLDSSYQIGILSTAAVPIPAAGIEAVLEVFGTETSAFDAEDVRALHSIAAWAATVLSGPRHPPIRSRVLARVKPYVPKSIPIRQPWRRPMAAILATVVLAVVAGNLYVHARPARAEIHERAGTRLLNLGKAASAVAEFRAAVTLNPGDARAHYGLGAALFRAGDYPGAETAFHNALSLDYHLAHAHNGLAIALLRQNRPDEAFIEFYQALRDDYTDADAHYYVGVLLSSRGMLHEALDEYSVALRLKPDHPSAHAGMAVAYLQVGSRSKSVASARKYFDRAWEETHLAQSLGASLDPSFLADLRGRLPDPAP